MASYQKFEPFVRDLAKGIHQLHAAGHTLKVMLTNQPPGVGNAVKADLIEIGAGFGYPAGGVDIQNDIGYSVGNVQLTGVDVTFTASGGSIGPFRWVALYNDTPTSPADPLVGWWDYGSSITLLNGESFLVDFNINIFLLS